MNVHIILYDGNCGICCRFTNFFYQKDKKERFKFIPFQIASVSLLRSYNLRREKCEENIIMLRKSGIVLKGAHCVNALWLQFFPYSIVSILAYVFFPLLLFELFLYKIIARKRHVISKWLGFSVCS